MKGRHSICNVFAALSVAVVLHPWTAIATSSIASLDCDTSLAGDGFCDQANNNEDCGYDGGDCCECTCVSTNAYTCGDNGFACVDPGAPCVSDDDVTLVPSDDDDDDGFSDDDDANLNDDSGAFYDDDNSLPCVREHVADGDCDTFNNNEDCDYDGGDCCQCTCVSTPAYTCGENEGFQCVDPSAPCVDDDDVTFVRGEDDFEGETWMGCTLDFSADGDCDTNNNREECGYDGGDCCQCTCVSTRAFTCGDVDFECIDPSAPCVDDDDVTVIPASDDDFTDDSTTSSSCIHSSIGDSFCDTENNNKACDYDGGDCCECTCISTPSNTCGDNDGFDCVDPSVFCLDGLVEAGTLTAISVSASAYDERPGMESNDIGCGQDGCSPSLARDRVITNIESRWSCASKIVPDGGVCEIDFTFETPQDIKELQAAFWKRAERERTLKVRINGDDIGEFDSDSESAFTSFSIETDGVTTLTLESIGIGPTEWISLLEVRFIVEP